MTRDTVTPEDLHLSVRTDGAMYDECCAAARIPGRISRAAAFERIINKGWKNYVRTVGPSFVHAGDMIEAARILEADMLAHVADMDKNKG